jgi:hypothetical protein
MAALVAIAPGNAQWKNNLAWAFSARGMLPSPCWGGVGGGGPARRHPERLTEKGEKIAKCRKSG